MFIKGKISKVKIYLHKILKLPQTPSTIKKTHTPTCA